jgi:tetratricopeptide (TPR) repeat protein
MENSSQNLFERGCHAFQEKRYDDALTDFDAAIALDSKLVKAYLYRAQTLDLLDRKLSLQEDDLFLDNVSEMIRVIYFSQPSEREQWLQKAQAAQEQRQERQKLCRSYRQRAMEDFLCVLFSEPDNAEAIFGRGRCRYVANDFVGARQDIDCSISLGKRDARTYTNSAALRFQQQDFAGMLADAETAMGFEPDNLYAYFYRGVARENLRDKKGALEDYEKATGLDDLSYQGQLLGRRGLLRLEQGRIFDGIGDLLTSLKFLPVATASN